MNTKTKTSGSVRMKFELPALTSQETAKIIAKMRRQGRAMIRDAIDAIPAVPPEFIPRLGAIAPEMPSPKTLLKALDDVPFEEMVRKARRVSNVLSILPDKELATAIRSGMTKLLKSIANPKRAKRLPRKKTK